MESKGTKKHVVMVVDDDAVTLNTVVYNLSIKYQIRPFTSGEKAMKYLEKNNIDLILLDYKMPGLSGFDILKGMQTFEHMRNIPVIMLTGSIETDTEEEALRLGAVDFIRKPINPQILIARVGLHLELLNHRKYLEDLVAEKTSSLTTLNGKLKARENVTLSLLARATDMRDHDTGDHLERTTEFVRIIVEDLVSNPRDFYRLSHEEGDNIISSAKLHDIGKIAIPDLILQKNGPLTNDEFTLIKKHADFGANMFNEFIHQMDGDSFLDIARDIAHTHHEHWNGKGYPRGLTKMSIPLSGRIVAIADVYDALTSTRPYKKPFSHNKSLDIICENSGSQFDPYLTSVFLRHEKAFKNISVKN